MLDGFRPDEFLVIEFPVGGFPTGRALANGFLDDRARLDGFRAESSWSAGSLPTEP